MTGGAPADEEPRHPPSLEGQLERNDMLDKDRLIDLILETNPSPSRDWLNQFKAEQLRSYLDHLDMTLEPRGRNSRWARPGDTPAVVWRKAG